MALKVKPGSTVYVMEHQVIKECFNYEQIIDQYWTVAVDRKNRVRHKNFDSLDTLLEALKGVKKAPIIAARHPRFQAEQQDKGYKRRCIEIDYEPLTQYGINFQRETFN
ncbi:MAG: hypothetical protein ACQESG_05645 [Nanobdellota archaeon]